MESETDTLSDWEAVQDDDGSLCQWSNWEWEFERVPAVSDGRRGFWITAAEPQYLST